MHGGPLIIYLRTRMRLAIRCLSTKVVVWRYTLLWPTATATAISPHRHTATATSPPHHLRPPHQPAHTHRRTKRKPTPLATRQHHSTAVGVAAAAAYTRRRCADVRSSQRSWRLVVNGRLRSIFYGSVYVRLLGGSLSPSQSPRARAVAVVAVSITAVSLATSPPAPAPPSPSPLSPPKPVVATATTAPP